MFRTLFCLRDQHDYGLVLLAALICLTASFAAMYLLRWSQRNEGLQRIKWLCLAGIATGSGIWATHFVAMLAYNPGVPMGFDLSLTLLSFAVAVVVTGAGLALATYRPFDMADAAGGAIAGVGIGAMHFMGMQAVEIPGHINWAPDLVAAAIIMGSLLSAIAVAMASRAKSVKLVAGAAGVMVLAIVSLHFTAMGAITVVPGAAADLNDGLNLPPAQMSVLIATAAFSVLFLSLAAALFGQKIDQMRSQSERRHRLMVESIKDYAICMLDADGNITDWNKGAEQIKGYSAAEIIGRNYSAFFPPELQNAGEPQRVLGEALTHGSFHEPEGLRVRKDGSTFWVDALITAIFDEEGKHVGFSKVTRDITARKTAEDRIQFMAQHDSLTGLTNRTYFVDRLDHHLGVAREKSEKVAVIGMDLDGFKEINDQQGHAVGDEVLRTLGARLKALDTDVQGVARIGGDEFVALKRFDDERDLHSFIERLNDALTEPVMVDGFELKPGASLGVAIFPQDGDSRDVLLNNADLAMYRAKASTTDTLCYYESSMDEAERNRRALARDLWHAVQGDELRLLYQVQRSVSGGQITGYEALLRWHHPTRGLVSPVDFIPVAEECGAIIDIGKWVLSRACTDAAEWPEHVRIAVNLSPAQLGDPDLIRFVHETLITTGLSPRRLELEITESMIIGDRVRALHVLRQLKALGVTIAIDDFGTGYSSLDTLNAFRFDKIKIDRSFLQDCERSPQARTIVRAIVGLGKSLEIKVLAEGVETIEQLDILKSEGCEEAQGYLFGRPQSIEADEVRKAAG